MPVVITNQPYDNQYGWQGARAPTTQLSFGQMLRQVTRWNSSLDPMDAARMINDKYREIIDRREWYGLKVRGNISIRPVVQGGQAAIAYGSNQAYGTGTAWTKSLIGLQFRIGFTYPYQSVIDVDEAGQVLTLDTIFGGTTMSSGGYVIVEAYVQPGNNIKRLVWAMNQQQGWPMEVNCPVPTINAWDVWRQSLGWSTMLCTRAIQPDGGLVLEVWPTPYGNQVFPFEAYTQPPDMENDDDSPAPFIRSDVIVAGAIADAVMICGRGSKWYNPDVSKMKLAQFERSIFSMEAVDEAMDLKDVTWEYGQEDGRVGFGPGSTYAQSHD